MIARSLEFVPAAAKAGEGLLWTYRERSGDPAFWAEPLNAASNVSFLIAAAAGLMLARRRRANSQASIALLALAGTIGVGSFIFHTAPNAVTLWMDVVPIATFQVLFLWLIARHAFAQGRLMAAAFVCGIVGVSLSLLPLREPLNGSLFYVPTLIGLLAVGVMWIERSPAEPFLLLAAALCFAVAVTARSIDWLVPWPFGTHFLWHLIDGVVVYLALRAWLVFAAAEPVEAEA